MLTHDSLDHVGGAAEVLRRLDVGLRGRTSRRRPTASPRRTSRAAEAARERGVPVREAAGRARGLAVGRWRLRVLSPARGRLAGQDPNPASMVALASADGLDALLTADAESDALAALALPPVDVLKVSHHGSEDPGLGPVLDRLRPAVAVVSAGEGNPFGHPRARDARRAGRRGRRDLAHGRLGRRHRDARSGAGVAVAPAANLTRS